LARVLSIATVLGLLLASALAFAITERAKTALSPIASTEVTKVFSPKAADATDRYARVRFRLRTRERLSVWIEDRDGTNVRTLLNSRAEKKGAHIDVQWDGFADDGLLEPDGTYRPVAKLENSHRTIALPNPIVLDTKAPTITVPKPLHPLLSPDGDHHGDLFRVHYRLDERAHALLFVRVGHKQQQVEFTRTQQPTGELQWNGKVQGNALRPGTYLLSVAAQDTAGNRSKPYPFAVANVRYVALGRSRVVVKAGNRFAIRVSTDAPTVHWKLHGRTGVAARGTLHFRAPKSKGVFFLYVFVGDHAARCAVVVT
jgi:flagellar hook assembly protein FlgD